MSKRCIGFGEFEDQCIYHAGLSSEIWCDRCEKLRKEYITKQFKELSEGFEKEE